MLCALFAVTAHAQKNTPAATKDWANVRSLAAGTNIRVYLTSSGNENGKIVSVADDAVVVDTGKGTQTIARNSIARLSARKTHRVRNALIGAGIGAGVGLGIGVGIDSSVFNSPLCPTSNAGCSVARHGKEIGAAGFGILGALIGALIPGGGWQDIYRV